MGSTLDSLSSGGSSALVRMGVAPSACIDSTRYSDEKGGCLNRWALGAAPLFSMADAVRDGRNVFVTEYRIPRTSHLLLGLLPPSFLRLRRGMHY